MKTAKQILLDAADLLEKPGAWTVGEWARVKQGGNPIGPEEPNAGCWCMIGAIRKISGENLDAYNRACELLVSAVGDNDLIRFNDAGSKSEVVAKLREAAELA